MEYVLIGKIIYIGIINDIPDTELLEYQDIIDFLTLFHANKEKVNLSFLKNKIKKIGLKGTLDRLLKITFEQQ